MTHADAFLADILAHPDDDALRLIFADWLEDHGEETRAEFIRVQCELAAKWPPLSLHLSDNYSITCDAQGRVSGHGTIREKATAALVGRMVTLHSRDYDGGLTACYFPIQIVQLTGELLPLIVFQSPPAGHPFLRLQGREQELLLRHGDEWLPRVGIKSIMHDGGEAEGISFEIATGITKDSGIRVDFRRGFVERVDLPAADWLTHCDTLTATTPLREVTLSTDIPVESIVEVVRAVPGDLQYALTIQGENARQVPVPMHLLQLPTEGPYEEMSGYTVIGFTGFRISPRVPAVREFLGTVWQGITFLPPEGSA